MIGIQRAGKKEQKIMKKTVLITLLIIIIAIFSVFLTSCGSNDVKHAVGSVKSFPFEASVKKADLIAQVEILKVVEETDNPIAHTVFEARVVNTIKGKVKAEDIIRFVFDGHSRFVFEGFPISVFEKGSNFILFLYRPTGKYDPPINDLYFPVAGYTSVYEIISIENEEIVTRRDSGWGDFKEMIDESLVDKVKAYKSLNKKKYEEIGIRQALKKDALLDLIKKEFEK